MSYFEGKDKNPEFKDFASLVDTFINDKELKMVSITPTVESIKRIDSDEYEVSYIVAYRFTFEDKYEKKEGSYTYDITDTYEKEQVFRYKKAKFIVSNEEVSEDNNDNYDSNNHYSYDKSIKIKDLGGSKGFEKISDKKHKISSDKY